MNTPARKALAGILMSLPICAFAQPNESEVNAKYLNSVKSAIYQPDNTAMTYSVMGDHAIIMGDIAVGKERKVAVEGIPNLIVKKYEDIHSGETDGFTAKSSWSGNTTWPNSTVPYVISAASQGDTAAILAGMNLISSRTAVKFVPRTNQADYIEVIKGSGCWSYVGRNGGRQELSIGNGCAYAGIVAHEFTHALGMWHEQSRADRDNYVRINYANISSGREHNFDKHGAVTTSLGGYDHRSIMHYGWKAFSSNGLPTIESLNPAIPSSQLGQRNNLTDLDAAALAKVYGGNSGGSGDITLYQHCNYTGYSSSIGEGSFTLSQLMARGLQNDDLSSLRVPAGYEVDLYQHDNFQGSKITITGDDSCLVDNGFNDDISSVVVRKITVATAYQHCDYNGYAVPLKVGNYTLSQLQQMGISNDDVSSLAVKGGYKVTMYQHDNFTGSSVAVTGNSNCLVNQGFNDAMSSVRITKN
ncbi:Flavastacin [Thalassocella blandensis]|nr:Flavastacin [Thalassocella blandensis]